eukprot:3354029-Prymnesium_polylepis.1
MGARRAQLAAQAREREGASSALQAELRAQLEEARKEREGAAMAAAAEGQRREAIERQRLTMQAQLTLLDAELRVEQ